MSRHRPPLEGDQRAAACRAGQQHAFQGGARLGVAAGRGLLLHGGVDARVGVIDVAGEGHAERMDDVGLMLRHH